MPELRSQPEIDITVSNPARVYDYLLGGTDNFAVDREVAEHMTEAHPGGLEEARRVVRAHRAFLDRAVRYLVTEAGVRQFLDVGCGIPTSHNTHEVAQAMAPEARIVYVDNDPVVLAHSHRLLRSTPEGRTAFLLEDLRKPDEILEVAAETLDLAEPVAIVLVAVVHFLGNSEDPHGIVTRLMDTVPPGSYLALLHMASDAGDGDEMAQMVQRHNGARVQNAAVLRSRSEVAGFFDGLELVEPGLVQPDRWRPDGDAPAVPEGYTLPSYAGIARKP